MILSILVSENLAKYAERIVFGFIDELPELMEAINRIEAAPRRRTMNNPPERIVEIVAMDNRPISIHGKQLRRQERLRRKRHMGCQRGAVLTGTYCHPKSALAAPQADHPCAARGPRSTLLPFTCGHRLSTLRAIGRSIRPCFTEPASQYYWLLANIVQRVAAIFENQPPFGGRCMGSRHDGVERIVLAPGWYIGWRSITFQHGFNDRKDLAKFLPVISQAERRDIGRQVELSLS
jgi:hypothetical protein